MSSSYATNLNTLSPSFFSLSFTHVRPRFLKSSSTFSNLPLLYDGDSSLTETLKTVSSFSSESRVGFSCSVLKRPNGPDLPLCTNTPRSLQNSSVIFDGNGSSSPVSLPEGEKEVGNRSLRTKMDKVNKYESVVDKNLYRKEDN